MDTTILLSGIIAYYLLKSKQAKAAEVTEVVIQKYSVPMTSVTLKPTVEDVIKESILYTPEIPEEQKPITGVVKEQKPIINAVSIISTLSPYISDTGLLTSPYVHRQQTTQEPILQPIQIQQPVDEKVAQEVETTYKESKFYADYSIPLYSIVERDITSNIVKSFTSFGASVYGIKVPYTSIIPDIQKLGKVDWSSIPKEVYINLAMDLFLQTFLPEAYYFRKYAPVVMKFIATLILGGSEEKTPQEKIDEAVNYILNYCKIHSVSPKNGFFLGFLARNRVNSAMIPLVKIRADKTGDTTYVPADIIPLITTGGYSTDGNIVGYISSIPFTDSSAIEILFNPLLVDLVLAQQGSEFNRSLVINDYIPIKVIGYVSNKFTKGQEGSYLPEIEAYESVKSTYASALDSLFNNTSTSSIRELSKNIRLSVSSNSLFPTVDIKNFADNIYTGLERPLVTLKVSYAQYYKITNTRVATKYNREYFSNATNLPKDPLIESLYEDTNYKEHPSVYLGIPVPAYGEISEIVVESKDTNYSYGTNQFVVKKGTKRLLVHQVDGAILEFILDDSVTPKAGNLPGIDTNYIINILKVVASSSDPKAIARSTIGKFFKIIDNRPAYYIDTNSDLKELHYNIYKPNIWTKQ
jgi:hypothetical protein